MRGRCVALAALVAAPAVQLVARAADPPFPRGGDVFVGHLEDCAVGGAAGFRLEVVDWPRNATLQFLPLAHFNEHLGKFEAPSHACSGEYTVSADVGESSEEAVEATFRPQHADSSSGCSPAFGLKGAFLAQRAAFGGRVTWPPRDGGAAARTSRRGRRAAPVSASLRRERGPPTRKPDADDRYGSFWCPHFAAEKCVGGEPSPGDKVVYFMRHAGALSEKDSPLSAGGEGQVKDALANDPNLARAVRGGTGERAELVLTSPLARAMHTALLGFRTTLPEARFEIDPDLVELGGLGTMEEGAGLDVLRRFGAEELQKQYEAVEGSSHDELPHHRRRRKLNFRRSSFSEGEAEREVAKPEGPELAARWARFTRHLLTRPEERIVAISHHHLLQEGTAVPLGNARTIVMLLRPDGTWRKPAQPPLCWPPRRGTS